MAPLAQEVHSIDVVAVAQLQMRSAVIVITLLPNVSVRKDWETFDLSLLF